MFTAFSCEVVMIGVQFSFDVIIPHTKCEQVGFILITVLFTIVKFIQLHSQKYIFS